MRVIRRMPDVVRVTRSLAAHARDESEPEEIEIDDQDETDK
jgi:hypothetical protein